MVAGVSTKTNVGVVTVFATEISPFAPPVQIDITVQNVGKAGIWQSGIGLLSDDARVSFATGNGQGHENKEASASGRALLHTLDECVVNLGIGSDGKLTLSNYFQPYGYVGIDAGDRDLGSGRVALLDSAVFRGQSPSFFRTGTPKVARFSMLCSTTSLRSLLARATYRYWPT